ncbi:GNAT family N-acetyltransferase [Enterococcus sp. LJL120]
MLETERLILRNFSADPTDLQALLQIMEDPVVNRFLPWFPLQDLTEAENFYQEKILPQMQQPMGIYWQFA